MSEPRPRGIGLIAVTIIVGLLLDLIPLPSAIEVFWPPWALLVLVYWSLAMPSRVGVGVAWIVGLVQDVLQGTLLGAHAIAFALAAYLTIQVYQRMRAVPIWQQAITVLMLLLIVRLILLWVRELMGAGGLSWQFWMPAVTGTIAWPLVFFVLRSLRRRYQVS
ncbi:MAG: rod shape-determining protein MreD [Spiribacter sp.]|jgi:rod shape-determining protein MreD|nr:rod shape-determining protein MreD [Spiribacter sp.]MDR9454645.1 rod shape-determining protein MreD [Spiribacter sp.]